MAMVYGRIPDISVVIPTCNRDESIETCIVKIKEIFRDKNLISDIIVSDSSIDRTADLAQRTGVLVIRPEKLGHGCN